MESIETLEFDSGIARQNLQRLAEPDVEGLLDPVEAVAFFAARPAHVAPHGGVHLERRVTIVVEWAQALPSLAVLFQRDPLGNQVDEVDPAANLVALVRHASSVPQSEVVGQRSFSTKAHKRGPPTVSGRGPQVPEGSGGAYALPAATTMPVTTWGLSSPRRDKRNATLLRTR